MKITKRFLTILLALCLLFSMVVPTLTVSAKTVDSGSCGKNVTWKLDDKGTLTISGNGKMDGYDWDAGIGAPWYDYCGDIKSIIIKKGVTNIGIYAFGNCYNATSVTIPSSVTSIDYGAFVFCEKLKTITIPSSVKNIASSAFENCYGLTSVTIGSGVTRIGDYAFCECTSLTSVTIPSSVTDLGYAAFGECYKLSSVTINKGIKSIGDYAFAYCEKLKSVTIPTSVTSINEGAFYGCTSLTGITIPSSVTGIEKFAFGGCSNLATITMNKGVKYIGECAFMECTSLTKVTIPNSVTDVRDYAFAACSKLKTVTIPDSVKSIGEGAFVECKSLTNVTIPDSVTTIGAGAFCYCESLTKITIPSKVKVINESVFGACTKLASVTIPNSVTTIGMNAFYGCSSLTGLTIPNSVTSIDDYAFFDCSSLTKVNIPSSVKEIGYGAFGGCDGLKSIYFNGNAPKMYEEYYDTANEICNSGSFAGVTATAYYLVGDTTWTEEVLSAEYTTDAHMELQGKLTWVALDPASVVPANPYKIANVVSGVHVYWDNIDGAPKYGLWRSETGKNGTYKWIANPTTYHFTDTKVESGKTYYYKVTTMNTATNKHSEMSEAIGITYVATPDITLRVNRAAGVGLRWDKIDGAKGYAIYRKSYYGNDAWVRVATISDPNTLNWDDTSVKNNNGEVYKYTIRALAGDDLKTLSGCRNTGRTMVRLTSRTLNSATKASSTSIKCTWATTSQATGYEVRFMVGDTVYKTYTIGNYKTGTKTFTDLQKGQTYKIQVRTYKKVDGVGSFYSAWSTAKNVKL